VAGAEAEADAKKKTGGGSEAQADAKKKTGSPLTKAKQEKKTFRQEPKTLLGLSFNPATDFKKCVLDIGGEDTLEEEVIKAIVEETKWHFAYFSTDEDRPVINLPNCTFRIDGYWKEDKLGVRLKEKPGTSLGNMKLTTRPSENDKEVLLNMMGLGYLAGLVVSDLGAETRVVTVIMSTTV
jgi:hypothetical protein